MVSVQRVMANRSSPPSALPIVTQRYDIVCLAIPQNIELAEVISHIFTAVSGDLIPIAFMLQQAGKLNALLSPGNHHRTGALLQQRLRSRSLKPFPDPGEIPPPHHHQVDALDIGALANLVGRKAFDDLD